MSKLEVDTIDTKTGTNSLTIKQNDTAAITIDTSQNVGIGTTSPSSDLHINRNGSDVGIRIQCADTTGTAKVQFGTQSDIVHTAIQFDASDNSLQFRGYNNSERMRIDSSGNVMVGQTTASNDANGAFTSSAGQGNFSVSGNDVLKVNRNTDDGVLIRLKQATGTEGTISVSGSTVSYNGFTGTHWSRLSDNSKPTILKGTILESLDEMCDWYQVQFDITETDDEGNETTRTEKQSYALGDDESVGDVITYTYEGTDYQATIIQEGDIKHTKSKVSDTVDAKNVYGVFVDWDNDDDTVNDMYVAQTGTFVVRLNSSVTTLNKGDLIQSNGDGTGKVQSDDIIRASTVAKVLSTTKIETYSDGSYIVPCSLHC
jgi:hypothetical protein